MPNENKIELFETMAIPKAIATLAIPTILSSLVMVIYNLADTYFVGMLNNPIQNAAVSFAGPVLLAFNAVNNLFGVGTSSLMSRALGAKDYEKVKRASATGFYFALFMAALVSICCITFNKPLLTILGVRPETYQATFEYLRWTAMFGAVPAILNVVMAYMVRAEGASLHASIGTMSGCILNMILDPFFILPWGLNMGAAGAGCATFLSNAFACLYFLILLKRKGNNTFVSIKPRHFSFTAPILLAIFIVGVPAAIQNLLNVTGMTILNNFTSANGTDAVAAMGIAQKINMVPVQVALGMSQGIMPLISYNYSSGNVKRMKDAYLTTVKIALTFLTLLAAIYYWKADLFIRLFMNNENIINIGSRFLKGFCLGLPFICFDFIGVGVYQAIGNGKLSLFFAIARKIILEIPLLFILNALFPLYGLPYAQVITEITLTIIAVFVISNIFKKLNKNK